MEQMLLKLARQLDTLDEASLMSLWDKYATLVSRFEPTRRWEESALVFSLIQSKRWKNQLFNQQWASVARPDKAGAPPQSAFTLEAAKGEADKASPKRGKVLSFRPKES